MFTFYQVLLSKYFSLKKVSTSLLAVIDFTVLSSLKHIDMEFFCCNKVNIPPKIDNKLLNYAFLSEVRNTASTQFIRDVFE